MHAETRAALGRGMPGLELALYQSQVCVPSNEALWMLPLQASSDTVRNMRGKTCLEKSKCHFGSCQQQYEGSPGHNRAVGAAMQLLVQQYLTTSPAADNTGLVGSGSTARGCGQEAALGGFKLLHQVTADLNVTTLAPSCPLFGRKINGTGAERWALVLKPFLVE